MDSCLVLHWRHTALCTAQPSINSSKKLDGDNVFAFWCRKTEEKTNTNFQVWLPASKNVCICIRILFSLSLYNAIWENFKTLQHVAFFSSFLTNSSAHTDTSSAYWVPVPSLPQFQRKSCKGKTKPPWNINIRNTVIKSRLFPCVPGLFLFRAFRSNPLWIGEPWIYLNIPPQSETGFSSPGKNLIWEFTELE